jgi:hypothetical protein
MILLNPSNTFVAIKAEKIEDGLYAIVVAYVDTDPREPIALYWVKETGYNFSTEFLGRFQLLDKQGDPIETSFREMVQTGLIAKRIDQQ